MSVFKKLASLLFEETDAEVLADDELEPIEIKETKKQNEKAEKDTTEELQSYFNPHAAANAVNQDEKKFVTIDLEEKPKEKKEPQPETSNEEVKRVKKTRIDVKEYEFSPVISPMFGSEEEKNAKPKKKTTASVVKKTKKKNPLGTIISPYYGVSELEEFEAKAQQKIEENEKKKQEELPSREIDKYEAEEEIQSVPLEEMIEHTDVTDKEEDLLQISLFGEATPIKHLDESSSDLQKE